MTKKYLSVVTGGSSGIGAACVRHLAKRGDLVIALDLPGTWSEAKMKELGVHAYPCDVTDEQAVRAEAGAVHGAPAQHVTPAQPPKRTKCMRAG